MRFGTKYSQHWGDLSLNKNFTGHKDVTVSDENIKPVTFKDWCFGYSELVRSHSDIAWVFGSLPVHWSCSVPGLNAETWLFAPPIVRYPTKYLASWNSEEKKNITFDLKITKIYWNVQKIHQKHLDIDAPNWHMDYAYKFPANSELKLCTYCELLLQDC